MGWPGLRSTDRQEPSLCLPCRQGRVQRNRSPGESEGYSLRQRAIPPRRREDLRSSRRARFLLRGPLRAPLGSDERARDGQIVPLDGLSWSGRVCLRTGPSRRGRRLAMERAGKPLDAKIVALSAFSPRRAEASLEKAVELRSDETAASTAAGTRPLGARQI